MSIYGEGLYRTPDGEPRRGGGAQPRGRRGRALGSARRAGAAARPDADPGMEAPDPRLGLRAGKYVQERLTLTLAPAYGMEGVALRLWNVYGPGQALSNPYTGVLAIFASRLHNGQPPMIFEDGSSGATSCMSRTWRRPSCSRSSTSGRRAGSSTSAAARTARSARSRAARRGHEPADIEPEITGKARIGDIRHCIADIAKIRRSSATPRKDFSQGLAELAEWVAGRRRRTACTRPARSSSCGLVA